MVPLHIEKISYSISPGDFLGPYVITFDDLSHVLISVHLYEPQCSCKNGPKMAQNSPKWSKMVQNGQKLPKMAHIFPKIIQHNPKLPKADIVIHYGPFCVRFGNFGSFRGHLGPFLAILGHFGPIFTTALGLI